MPRGNHKYAIYCPTSGKFTTSFVRIYDNNGNQMFISLTTMKYCHLPSHTVFLVNNALASKVWHWLHGF